MAIAERKSRSSRREPIVYREELTPVSFLERAGDAHAGASAAAHSSH